MHACTVESPLVQKQAVDMLGLLQVTLLLAFVAVSSSVPMARGRLNGQNQQGQLQPLQTTTCLCSPVAWPGSNPSQINELKCRVNADDCVKKCKQLQCRVSESHQNELMVTFTGEQFSGDEQHPTCEQSQDSEGQAGANCKFVKQGLDSMMQRTLATMRCPPDAEGDIQKFAECLRDSKKQLENFSQVYKNKMEKSIQALGPSKAGLSSSIQRQSELCIDSKLAS